MSGGVQRIKRDHRYVLRPTMREPIDKTGEPEMENRQLFHSDPARQAAIDAQRRRIQRELRKRKRR